MKLVLKIAGGALALALLAAIAVGVLVISTAIHPTRAVGVQQVLAADPGHPPVAVTVWYPTTSRPRLMWMGITAAHLAPNGAVAGDALPLVVVSHGTGGAPTSHLDTVIALVEAGYVVATPTHNGDNFRDSSKVGTPDWIVDRAREVARANDFLLAGWKDHARIDPRRIGVFGFSAGGTTALVTAGGAPDLTRIAGHCAARPEFVCKLMKPGAPGKGAATWTHDPRVRAAVVVAPGLGFTFEPDGLKGVTAPVQLWEGDADASLPLATNAAAVRRLLPQAPEFHLVPGADHFSFLAPCGVMRPLLPPMLCADPKGFDRKRFHRTFNAAVVRFFDARMSRTGAAVARKAV